MSETFDYIIINPDGSIEDRVASAEVAFAVMHEGQAFAYDPENVDVTDDPNRPFVYDQTYKED